MRKETSLLPTGEYPLRAILLFTLIAFAFPLLYSVPVNFWGLDQKQTFSFLLFGIAAAAPSVAAVLTVTTHRGKKGLQDFFRASFPSKIRIGSLSLALILALGIALAIALLKMIVTGVPFLVKIPTPTQLLVIGWALVAEELGWRGFLHKALEKKLPSILVPLLVGLLWTLWHYHFYITGNMTTPLLLLMLSCIADSYIYRYLLRCSGGGILPAMLYHMFGNLFPRLFLLAPEANGGDTTWYAALVLLSCVVAALLTVHSYRPGKTLPRKQVRSSS